MKKHYRKRQQSLMMTMMVIMIIIVMIVMIVIIVIVIIDINTIIVASRFSSAHVAPVDTSGTIAHVKKIYITAPNIVPCANHNRVHRRGSSPCVKDERILHCELNEQLVRTCVGPNGFRVTDSFRHCSLQIDDWCSASCQWNCNVAAAPHRSRHVPATRPRGATELTVRHRREVELVVLQAVGCYWGPRCAHRPCKSDQDDMLRLERVWVQMHHPGLRTHSSDLCTFPPGTTVCTQPSRARAARADRSSPETTRILSANVHAHENGVTGGLSYVSATDRLVD